MDTTSASRVAVSPKSQTSAQPPAGVLRTTGYLGRHPWIGWLLVIIGGGLFGLLAFNLQTGGALVLFDTQAVNALHTIALQSSPIVRDVMIFGFYVGDQAIIAIGVVLVVYFLFKRYWLELWMVVIAWLGEGALWHDLAFSFNRARPVFETSVWRQMTEPGFPSGHSISAVMCYGLLAYLIIPKIRSRFGQIAGIIITLLIIGYIGFSRVFVGDHYPTDVLAGFALGVFWFGLVYTAVELIGQLNRRRAT